MQLIARHFARKRSLQFKPYLERRSTTMQRGASRQQRAEQAREAFGCNVILDPDIPYLVIDDVVTTGATLEHASRTLRQAGAKNVWVAAVAKQAI